MGTNRLLEEAQVVEGFPTVDLQTGSSVQGDWVSMEEYNRCAVVFTSGVGTAGDDPTITLFQATNNAASGSKALTFEEIYVKQAATSLAAVGQFSRTTQAATNSFTDTDGAEQSLIWVIEFLASDLDVDNKFDHLKANVSLGATTATQPGSLQYVLSEPAEHLGSTAMISAL